VECPPRGRRPPRSPDRAPLTGYWIKSLEEIPLVPEDEPGDPLWYPLQHHFGFTAFGINVYTAPEADGALIGDHDEAESEQEELYLVTAGSARFTIDGREAVVPAGAVVAITDPAVRRTAVAAEPGTTVVVVGGRRAPGFDSSWQPQHFESVPTVQK
jgi:quercetin dioxygenase-like cupin family protein